MLTNLRLRLKGLAHRRRLDRDLEEELAFHLALRKEGYEASGASAEEAHAAAQREFGNLTGFREACRDMWTFQWLENFWQDLNFAARTLRKQPGFTAMAIVSLGLGIGANTAVFTLMNDLLLKTIPVNDPEHLVSLGKAEGAGVAGGLTGSVDLFPYEFYKDLRDNSRGVFRDVCAYGSFTVQVSERSSGLAASPDQTFSALVSGDFFPVLGMKAALGRMIDSTDLRKEVAVISFDYWQRRFSGDRGIIGKGIIVNGTPVTVIGVAPRGFHGVTLDARLPDMWLPITMQEQAMLSPSMLGPNGAYWLHMMARLQPGVSLGQAQGWLKLELQHYMLTSEADGLTADRKEEIRTSFIDLVPGGGGVSRLRGRFAQPLRILMGIVALVLVIACANLANFFLAKMATREKEITTRLALGAGTFRIVRQMLTETMLVSFLGGATGLLFAAWGTRALIKFVVAGAARTPFDPNPDLRVLAFTFAVSVFTGLLFGLAPAWRATRINLAPELKASSRTASGRVPLAKLLVASQVALSLVLLVGAGLCVRTLLNLESQSFGFNPSNVLMANMELRIAGYRPERLPALYDRVLAAVDSLPGVRSASISAVAPIQDGSWNLDVFVRGHVPQPHENLISTIDSVTSGYFETSGTHLLAGRWIGPQDRAGSLNVVVVNQSMARHFFPRGEAIGKYMRVGDQKEERQVVGIVEDGKYQSPREKPESMVFLPVMQLSGEDLFAGTLLVRTAGDPLQLTADLRRALAQIDSNIPLNNVTTLSEQVDQSMAQENLISKLSTFFSLLALLLACIGVYGAMTYNVVRRAREIGIRMALGAAGRGVLWMVLKEALLLLAAGVAVGIPVALVAMRYVESQLFGLSPSDPLTIAAATVAIGLVTLMAGYLPARRATQVDPLVALRYE